MNKFLNKFYFKEQTVAEAFKECNITDEKLKYVLNYANLLLDNGDPEKIATTVNYDLYLLIMEAYSSIAWYPAKGSEVRNYLKFI